MNRNNRNSMRNKVLTGAIVSALAAGTAAAAPVAYLNYTVDNTWAQSLALYSFMQQINNGQNQSGALTASIATGTVPATYNGLTPTVTNSNNSALATAGGNSAAGAGGGSNIGNSKPGNSIDLALLAASGPNSGLGILSGQADTGNIVSKITTGNIATALTGSTGGTSTQSDNTVAASTQVNYASNAISGNLPNNGFAGTTSGGITSQMDVTALAPAAVNSTNEQGDLALSNVQNNTSKSSSAVASSNISTVDTTNAAVATSFTGSGNQTSASFGGNVSANGIDAKGGAVAYDGSAVVNNSQLNDGATGSAKVTDSSIFVQQVGTGNFSGVVSESNNGISAGAQGNSANNSIAFANGINLSGEGSSGLDLGLKYTTHAAASNADADLALLNQQANYAGNFSSSISRGGVTVTVNNVSTAGSSVAVSDNRALATAGGNGASNSITANSGSSFADTVALGNQQSDANTPVSASNTANIGAYLAATGQTSRGSVTVSGNALGASASGNSATTSANVGGTSFAAGSGENAFSVGLDTGIQQDSVNTGTAGVQIGNLQNNKRGSNVTASVSGDTYINNNGAVAGGSATLSNNAITASAFGNDAVTGGTLSGTNATTSAALGSYQDSESNVAASLSLSAAVIDVGGNVAGAALGVSDNSLSASAYGNRGSNALGTSFTNATLGTGGAFTAPSSSIGHAGAYAWLGSNSGTAALGLASSQYATGSVTGNLNNAFANLNVLGNVGTSTLTVQGNNLAASAVANSVNNTLSPGVGNLSTGGGSAAQIASLSNAQNAYKSVVTASSTNTSLFPAVGVGLRGTVAGTPTSVSDNQLSAFAAGNMASNGMAVTGSNFAPTAVTGTNGESTFNGNTATIYAAFTVQSAQDSIGGSRSATVNSGSIGAEVAGNVTGSPLTVSDNGVATDVRDNYASNSLSFTGFSSLDTTAALQNIQISAAPLTSKISNTSIGAGSTGGNISGSAVSVSGDLLSAKALANTAFNTLAVQSGQLNGDGVGILGSHGANAANDLTLADYGLSNDQSRTGAVAASITAGSINGGLIGGGADGSFSGGSMTVTGNAANAFAQSNSATNTVALSGTSIDASAALFNSQSVGAASNASASVTSAFGFAAYAGGALGGAAVTPFTVTGNKMTAQAGLNDATNSVAVTGDSSIAGDGTFPFSGGDTTTNHDAVADYALYSQQSAGSSVTAKVAPGLSGIQAGGTIGGAAASALTVSDNAFTAQARANNASNSVGLTEASSTTATAALTNVQSATGGTVAASTTGAQVGIYDTAGANIRNAPMTVSGNALNAEASGNSASNSLDNLPVALNSGSAEPTSGTIALNGASVLASNAVLNAQSNSDAINATVSNASIGINPGLPGAASPLLTSTATVGNNVAAAMASGNSAANSIELANLSTGVGSSGLVSNQINSAAISASVTNVQIGVTAGAASTTPTTVSGNVISATAVGNSVSNAITVHH